MPTYDDLIKMARRIYDNVCIEINDEALVHPERHGAMVQAWVWVPYEEEENIVNAMVE